MGLSLVMKTSHQFVPRATLAGEQPIERPIGTCIAGVTLENCYLTIQRTDAEIAVKLLGSGHAVVTARNIVAPANRS